MTKRWVHRDADGYMVVTSRIPVAERGSLRFKFRTRRMTRKERVLWFLFARVPKV